MKRHVACIEFWIDLPDDKNIYDYVQDTLFQDEAISYGQIEMLTTTEFEESENCYA